MHILLTDVLTCPRCGPEFGLIVLADRLEARRVLDGSLGCANCREQYAVRGGVAELEAGGAPAGSTAEPLAGDSDRAYRIAALLGVGDSSALVLLLGAAPELAGQVAELLPHAEVVAAGRPAAGAGAGTVNWFTRGAPLPFRSRSLHGAALLGGGGEVSWAEVARVLRPGAHLVVDPASQEAKENLEKMGMRLLLDQEGVMVAVAPGPG